MAETSSPRRGGKNPHNNTAIHRQERISKTWNFFLRSEGLEVHTGTPTFRSCTRETRAPKPDFENTDYIQENHRATGNREPAVRGLMLLRQAGNC